MSRFVASFMGDADFLPADARRRRARVRARRSSRPRTDIGAAEVVLRPHEVALGPVIDEGAGMSVGARAVVTRVEYHGAFVLHTVRLASGRTLRSWQPHSVRYPVGTELQVSLGPGIVPSLLDGERTLETAPTSTP